MSALDPHYYVAPTRLAPSGKFVAKKGPCVRCGKPKRADIHLRPPGEASLEKRKAA